MYSNSQNSILANYMNFVSSSQESIHELISLIRQQDSTFQNILTRPPPHPSSLNNQSIYYPNRSTPINNRRNQRNVSYNTHNSGPYSYPSRNYIPNNLIFRNIQERILPREANINNNQNPATMIQILRATETKLYSEIIEPVNSTCPISQEEFTQNQEIIQIKSCQHNFKPDALLRWFSTNSTCPFCRYDIRNFNNTDISNNEQDDTSEMDIENSTINNNTININNDTSLDNTSLDNTSSTENMVQAISRLIGEEIRENLNNDNEDFQYTIVGRRIPSPESRE